MRDLRILLVQTRYALVAAGRNSRVIVFGIVFPVFLLILFNSIFASGKNSTTGFAGGTISTKAYFTAGLAAYAIMLQTYSSLAIAVTTQRETGQLKRLRGTPMPAWTFIGAYILRGIILSAVMVVVLFAIGAAVFGVHLDGSGILGIAVYAALGTAALATLGIAVTIFCPTVDSASSIGPFSAVILSFVSGVFIPVSTLPAWLQSVGRVFPLYHLADGMQRAVVTGGGGTGITADDVGSLVIWAAVGLVFAARRFRWEPQSARG
jgi:ABC-2 type transport system permease protein